MGVAVPAFIVPGHDAAHATSAARYLEECLPQSSRDRGADRSGIFCVACRSDKPLRGRRETSYLSPSLGER
jgi:hypothetical protein